MTGYTFQLACASCGGHMAHLNGSALGTESVAVARCEACGREWVVRVYLAPHETPERRAARERQARKRAGLAVVS